MRKFVSQQFAIAFAICTFIYLLLLIGFAFLVLQLEIDLNSLVYGRAAKVAMIATPIVFLGALFFEIIGNVRKK